MTLAMDCELIQVAPHMHLRGRSMALTATYPTGERDQLLNVPSYDFNWQLSYDLSKPKTLPRGTVLQADGSFDNSANNRFNPNPGVEVRWGDQTLGRDDGRFLPGCRSRRYGSSTRRREEIKTRRAQIVAKLRGARQRGGLRGPQAVLPSVPTRLPLAVPPPRGTITRKDQTGIQYAYENLATKYVMLVGDTHKLPVRYQFVWGLSTWYGGDSRQKLPPIPIDGTYWASDLYYANLYHSAIVFDSNRRSRANQRCLR